MRGRRPGAGRQEQADREVAGPGHVHRDRVAVDVATWRDVDRRLPAELKVTYRSGFQIPGPASVHGQADRGVPDRQRLAAELVGQPDPRPGTAHRGMDVHPQRLVLEPGYRLGQDAQRILSRLVRGRGRRHRRRLPAGHPGSGVSLVGLGVGRHDQQGRSHHDEGDQDQEQLALPRSHHRGANLSRGDGDIDTSVRLGRQSSRCQRRWHPGPAGCGTGREATVSSKLAHMSTILDGDAGRTADRRPVRGHRSVLPALRRGGRAAGRPCVDSIRRDRGQCRGRLGDSVAGYRDLPWVDRIAAELAAVRPALAYLNLGRRDLLAAQVRAEQLRPALAFGRIWPWWPAGPTTRCARRTARTSWMPSSPRSSGAARRRGVTS